MPININHAQNKLSTDSTLTVDSTSNVSLSGTSQIKDAVDPTDAQDLTTKAYVDSQVAGGGGDLTLGTPTDGTFGDGSYKGLDTTATITDAIDDLNETMEIFVTIHLFVMLILLLMLIQAVRVYM